MQRVHMLGKTYGELTVIEEFVTPGRITCHCSCGNTKEMGRLNVLSGKSKSCGCKQGEGAKLVHTIHGRANKGDRTYQCWCAMFARCYNPCHEHYHRYGGRGIEVCGEWNDFTTFLKDMGEKPEGKELDREDNNGPYCKSNCRWLTHKENCNNRGY